MRLTAGRTLKEQRAASIDDCNVVGLGETVLRYHFEYDDLVWLKRRQSGALKRGAVNEDVAIALGRLDKAVAAALVEPANITCMHCSYSF